MRKARIHITYKNGVLDPEGQTVMQSLSSLGFQGIEDVRIGKFIEIDISSVDNSKKIAEDIKRMCEELLVNLVIENYEIELD
ncbi:MAG: phosphoribosylformylglycinamidine synthase subunit PurS [Nitrospinota bacterium]|nr:phosphoribosylformylglycinamidine synthase subunit PurS [Nitrospinota bacterium]